MRYLTIFVCFLAICLSLLFVKRLYITERIIENRLQAIGGTDIQVTVSSLNRTGLLVDSLNANFSHDFPLQSVQLYDLTLPYNLRELLKGKVEIPGLLVRSLKASFSDDLAIRNIQLSGLALHSDQNELLKGKVRELEIGELTLQLNKPKEKETNQSPVDIRSYLPQKISIHKLTLPVVPQIEGDLNFQLFIQNSKEKPLDIELNITGKEVSLPGWDLLALTGNLLLQTDNGTVISLLHGSQLEIRDIHGATAHLEEARFLLSGKLVNIPDKGWLAGPATITAKTGGIQFQDLFVKPSPVSLQIKEPLSLSSPLQLHSSLDTSHLVVEWKDKSVPLKDILIDFVADKHRLQFDLLFSHAVIPGQIEGSLSHNLLQNKGTALFTTAHPFDLTGEAVNSDQLVKGMTLPFLLTSGLINFSSNIQWENNNALFVNSDFELQNGTGEVKNFLFSGLHIQQSLQLYPTIHTVRPGTVFVSELDNGFTIKNIELHNQIIHAGNESLPTLLIHSVEAEILGGRVTSKAISIDPLLQDFDLPVQLHGIALDKVVNLNKLDGLSVTGLMDGSVRLQRKNGQFSIPEGKLHSRQPGGVISYRPPGGSKALSQLPPAAMKALEEFNYDTLTATPRYEADGTLTIAIHTEGNSPPLNSTRPVHLNLNTEQNLLSLLQSLRYSKRLTDDLEQRLRTRPLKD